MLQTYIRNLAWKRIKRWVRQSFPAVPTISTEELAYWLKRDSSDLPVLIDARELEEFELSHLPGAYHAQSVAEVEKVDIDKETPIVVYCSIGYRSARLAQKLEDTGYQAVNLEGSLFEWANEHRDLVTNQKTDQGVRAISTQKVHPYNALWGLLLEPNS